MAQSGYTPILIYASGTATNVPLAANMTSSASGAELALNYADGKLYYKNSSGVVTLLASATTVTNSFSAGTTGFTPNTATTGAVTLAGTLATTNGGTGLTSFTSGGAVYATSTSALTTGTLPVTAGGTGLTSLTSGYIPFGNGTSALNSSSNLTFLSSVLSISDSSTARISLNAASTTTYFNSYNNASSGYVSAIYSATQHIWNIGATEAGRFDTGGNLLINTVQAISGSKVSVENAGYSAGSSGNTNQTNLLLSGYGYRIGATTYGNTSIRSTYSNSNNAASLEFYTGSSGTSTAEVGRFASSGEFGIGLTNPATYGKLAVSGNIGQWNNVASGSELARIQWYNSGTNYDVASIRTIVGAGQVNRGELGFYTNNGAGQLLAMYIDRSQYVGIGTNTPDAKLAIVNGWAHISNGTSSLYVGDAANLVSTTPSSASAIRFDGSALVFSYSNTEAGRFDSNGYFSLGVAGTTVNSSQLLTIVNSTGGFGIGFGQSSSNYSNIWSAYSSGAIVLAGGLQSSKSSDAYTSSYGGSSMYRTAIRLDTFNGSGIQFFCNNSSTVAQGTAITPTEIARFTPTGNFLVGTTSTYGKVTVSLTGVVVSGNTTGTSVGSGSIVSLYNSGAGSSTDGVQFLLGQNSGNVGGIASGFGFVRENTGNWGTQIRFYTHSTSTSVETELNEIARMDSSGSMLMNAGGNRGGTADTSSYPRLIVGASGNTSGGNTVGGFGEFYYTGTNGGSTSFRVINGSMYLVAIWSSSSSASANPVLYLVFGLNKGGGSNPVFQKIGGAAETWSFSYALNGSYDTIVTVTDGGYNQGTRVVVMQLGSQ